jgi:hypothetical protein
MKTKLLALVLLAAGSMFAGTRVVVGVGVGVRGYGYGYYARPYWVPPRYYGHRYFRGYWHR